MMLIAVLVGLGCLKVSQRNAIFLQAYAIGDRLSRIHTQETDVSWLNTRVVGLSSPTHLADVAQERRLNLVAWSTFAGPPSFSETMPIPVSQGMVDRRSAGALRALAHIASIDPSQERTGDTSD